MFLRELPEPVIPFSFFDKFVAACSESMEKYITFQFQQNVRYGGVECLQFFVEVCLCGNNDSGKNSQRSGTFIPMIT